MWTVLFILQRHLLLICNIKQIQFKNKIYFSNKIYKVMKAASLPRKNWHNRISKLLR